MTYTALADVEELVRRALVALPGYRDDIILVGGMVPHLYRRLPVVRVPEHPAIATTEADLSIRRGLPVVGDATIPDLLATASFVIYDVPGLNPRIPGYQRFQDAAHGTSTSAPTYLEFLTPLRGKPIDGLVSPHPGLRAPALRYLDLFPYQSMSIDIAIEGSLAPCPVRVPHPVMYVLQKVLARDAGRANTKQPKDMAYVYDVALLFQPLWPGFAKVFEGACAEASEWKSWLVKAEKALATLFKDEFADGAIEAASIYKNMLGASAPSARSISRVVTAFRASLGA